MFRRFVVLGAAVLAACSVTPSAWGAPAVNTTVPVSFVTSSQCPTDGGEQVAFQGSMHLTYILNSDPSGGYRELFHADVHLFGVGLTTGDRYVTVGGDTTTGVYPSGRGAVVTLVSHVQQIHAGEAQADDDFSMRMVLTPGGFSAEREACG